jgi:hypothetical protein
MNIILEKRKSILEENNIAQNQLQNALENVPKSMMELYLPQAFHGDLDFSILKELEIEMSLRFTQILFILELLVINPI